MSGKGIRAEQQLKRIEWQHKFLTRIVCCHKRNLPKVVNKILKRADTTRAGLMTRSKKYNVVCDITTEEIRKLLYDNYGTKCKYCDNILTINNLVFDHIIPISRGGDSNILNIQVICKTSNGMKGSLNETDFNLLLEWLQTVSVELRKDISIRLARGVI